MRPFGLLAAESVRDASRRRIVPAVTALSLLVLATMESCSSCHANLVVGGQAAPLDLQSWAGLLSFSVLGLFAVALAGLLAADHLRALFDDGSAVLLLSRPVSRVTLVLSRLAGSLAVSLASALLLCGGATWLLVGRGGLAPAPALWASAAVVVSSVTVAALAMTVSLFLPRIVTVLAVLGGVGTFAVLNALSASGRALGTVAAALDALGPPLLSAIVLALAPWSGRELATLSALDVVLRALVWAAGSVALLAVLFDQRDLTALETP